jgi:hypothetical protein
MRFRSTCARIVLAATLAVSAAGLAEGQGGELSPNSFAIKHSIAVIGSGSPLFQTLLDKDFPGATGVQSFQSVRPLLAIVHNNTLRIVDAYAVEWVVDEADGSMDTIYLTAVNGPLDDWMLTGQTAVIGPAGTRLVSPFFHWSRKRFPVLLSGGAVVATFGALAQQVPVVQQPLTFEALAARSIQVKLDGAIFGDGVCVGPDTSELFERFKAEQKAQVDEASWVLSELKTSPTNQQLRDALSEQIYKGRNATATDAASFYIAARGRAAEGLLAEVIQRGEQHAQAVAVRLSQATPMALRKKVVPSPAESEGGR